MNHKKVESWLHLFAQSIASIKSWSDDYEVDIFIKDYDQSHALALGFAYTRALNKLGLDDFFDNNQKFIEQNKSA